jgi:hypothetical protein
MSLERAHTIISIFAAVFCVLSVVALSSLACADGPDTAPPPVMEVRWYAITPPRAGLRCWFANINVEQSASYCEPDPTATHGVSP